MKNKLLIISSIVLATLVGTVLVTVFVCDRNNLPFDGNSMDFHSFQTVKKFGSFKLGDSIPLPPGSTTFAPWKKIPPSDFYVNIAEYDEWCILGSCNFVGQAIGDLGGWLQIENTWQLEVDELFGLDIHKDVESIVFVGNRDAKIVGIYPHKGNKDLEEILKLHGDLFEPQFIKSKTPQHYVNKKFQISIEFPAAWKVQEVDDTRVHFVPQKSADGVIEVTFKNVSDASTFEWFDREYAALSQEGYLRSTTTAGHPYIHYDHLGYVFSVVKPGVLMTIKDHYSEEWNGFRVELLKDIIEQTRVLEN